MRNALKRYCLLATVAACPIVASAAAQRPSPEELLGKGLHQEEIEGNCAAAIGTYKSAAEHPDADNTTAGRALLQMARCYERLGRGEARATYQRVLKTAPSGSLPYVAARTKLASTQSAAEDPLAGRNIDAYFKDASMVTPSASGMLVAYTRPKPGRFTRILGEQAAIRLLCVRDLSTGQERVLEDPGDRSELVRRIAWSPDGESIAYLVQLDSLTHPVKNDRAFDLRIVTISNGQVRTIVGAGGRSWTLEWSPDSRFLAFDRPGNDEKSKDLVVWNRASNETRAITTMRNAPAERFSWSPDSTRVALLSNGTKPETLVIVSVDTGRATTLATPIPPEGAELRLGAWNVNGEIAVSHRLPQVGNDFYMVPADGRPHRKVCEGRGASGGDGCQPIDAFNTFQVVRRNTTEGGRALLRDLVTGAERAFTDNQVLEQPVLLPGRGGKLVVFRSDRDGDFGLYVAPVDQLPVRNPARIGTLDSATSRASGWWTSDGLILNMSRTDANIYRVDVDSRTGKPTSAARRLTHETVDNQGASASPDGRRIAYRVRDRKHGIAIMDANGVNERLVLPVPPDRLLGVGAIGWRSPRELLLHGQRIIGPSRLSVLDLETGKHQPLSSPDIQGAGLNYRAVTDEVFYWRLGKPKSDAHSEVWARSVKKGTDRLVARTAPHSVFFHISNDGRHLFYSTANDNVEDGRPVPTDLHIVSLQTGEDKVIASFPDSKGAWNVAALASFGNYLLYQDPDKAKRIMDVRSGKSWPLLTEALRGVDVGDLSSTWSADGSYVLFTGFSERSERRQWKGLTYEAVTSMIKKGTQ